jgi:hypothetical protein
LRLVEERTGIPTPHWIGRRAESELVADIAVAIGGTLVATEAGSASVAAAKGISGQDLSQPALQPPLELCTQRRPLLPLPAEELTRSICRSLDWQRAGRMTQGRVTLSQQLVDRVIRAETGVS